MHSLISFALALYVNQKPEPLGSCLLAGMQVGKSLLADNIYQDCGIKINEHRLEGKFDTSWHK